MGCAWCTYEPETLGLVLDGTILMEAPRGTWCEQVHQRLEGACKSAKLQGRSSS